MIRTKVLLLDFSNIAHATYYVMLGKSELKTPEDKFDFWRFLMLSMMKNIKIKHQPTEYVICVDSISWRKKFFKYYKASRDKKKEDVDFNFKYFVEKMNDFLEEVDETFHYKVLKFKGAEADDIISILSSELSPYNDTVVIASNDKDFKQLIKGNIHLYNIREEKFVTVDNPREYLIFHVLNGDSGDGVPNVRSDDDVFVDDSKRQKPCGAKQISKILEEGIKEYVKREGLIENYKRNRKLIDLGQNYIPKKIWGGVWKKYRALPDKKPDVRKIMMYFGEHDLRSLMNEVSLFIN